jgi:hypothetical protein
VRLIHRALENLRRQDWTAIAVELVVVVLGVFIGVQASNWNAELETNQKAKEFTERLKSDLREEAWAYEMQVSYFSQVRDNAVRAADALEGYAPLDDEALLVAAYRATQYNSNVRRRATYDELTSTGEIGLVRDAALRELAMRTFTSEMFTEVVTKAQTSRYRTRFRETIPHDVQRTLAATCGDRLTPVGDYAAIVHALDYPCSTGLPAAAIAKSAAIVRNDPELLAVLRLRIADLETDLANLTVFYRDDLRAPLQRLAKESP